MKRYYYDLHIHSCLSPCAEDDATPANIAAMAALNGLEIVALTDHNSCRNCPPFFQAASALGLIPIAGMELTTAEDIHVICLFPDLTGAMDFDREVDARRIRIPNRSQIFGRQLILDADERILGEEPDLLINATTLSLEDAFHLCGVYGGVCYPAHIDRASNGIVAVLGAFPPHPPYTAYELHDADEDPRMRERFSILTELTHVVSSDAHELGAIAEAENFVLLDDASASIHPIAEQLVCHLRRSVRPEAYYG